MTADLRNNAAAQRTAFSYAADTVVRPDETAAIARTLHDIPAAQSDGGVAAPADRPRRGRIFAAYCSGGRVVQYDSTCALWVWIADADEATRIRTKCTDPAVPLPVTIVSVSNVVHLPFVQASQKKERIGLIALGAASHKWVCSSPAGISTSLDCGATWSKPQHAFTGQAVALDAEEACVVCMKPAVALLGRKALGPRTTKAPARKAAGDEWELVPLPRTLRMAVAHDCVAVE